MTRSISTDPLKDGTPLDKLEPNVKALVIAQRYKAAIEPELRQRQRDGRRETWALWWKDREMCIRIVYWLREMGCEPTYFGWQKDGLIKSTRWERGTISDLHLNMNRSFLDITNITDEFKEVGSAQPARQTVLKTAEGKTSEGSTPSPTATRKTDFEPRYCPNCNESLLWFQTHQTSLAGRLNWTCKYVSRDQPTQDPKPAPPKFYRPAHGGYPGQEPALLSADSSGKRMSWMGIPCTLEQRDLLKMEHMARMYGMPEFTIRAQARHAVSRQRNEQIRSIENVLSSFGGLISESTLARLQDRKSALVKAEVDSIWKGFQDHLDREVYTTFTGKPDAYVRGLDNFFTPVEFKLNYTPLFGMRWPGLKLSPFTTCVVEEPTKTHCVCGRKLRKNRAARGERRCYPCWRNHRERWNAIMRVILRPGNTEVDG